MGFLATDEPLASVTPLMKLVPRFPGFYRYLFLACTWCQNGCLHVFSTLMFPLFTAAWTLNRKRSRSHRLKEMWVRRLNVNIAPPCIWHAPATCFVSDRRSTRRDNAHKTSYKSGGGVRSGQLRLTRWWSDFEKEKRKKAWAMRRNGPRGRRCLLDNALRFQLPPIKDQMFRFVHSLLQTVLSFIL